MPYTMKKTVSVFVLFLLFGSLLVIAETEEESSCSGFWGSLQCFFQGNPQKTIKMRGNSYTHG